MILIANILLLILCIGLLIYKYFQIKKIYKLPFDYFTREQIIAKFEPLLYYGVSSGVDLVFIVIIIIRLIENKL